MTNQPKGPKIVDLDVELERAKEAAADSERELAVAYSRFDQALRQPLGIAQRIRDDPVRWIAGAFAAGLIVAQIRKRG